MYDFIIIGAGYAGLSAAALLAKAGLKILLLESHTVIGGCASYFKRKEFTFDVGATTFSGVLPHQPAGKLFNTLGINPNLKKIDPGMIIKIKGKDIVRFADKEKWIEEASDKFKSKNQKEFWEKIFEIDEKIWRLISENETLLSSKIIDFTKYIKLKNLNYLNLLPLLKRSVKYYSDKFIPYNIEFNRFLDEQLLITTQNYSSESPMLTGSVGLAYPSQTYYPYGGMYKPAELIARKFTELGGEIKFKEKVNSLTQASNSFSVKTANGKCYSASGIVASIPFWNLAKITEGRLQKYFAGYSKKFNSAWGAFIVNFAVQDSSDLRTVYFQIHVDEVIPYCNARAFFVSFSLKDDIERAPAGYRTVTISTHSDSKNWFNISKAEYARRKDAAETFIIKKFGKEFPNLAKKEKLFLMSGTPKSFQFYTNRFSGFVGGISHSVSKTLVAMPPNVTPFKNLFCIGDTAFPGQGTPSVILGAMSASNFILND